MERLDFTKTSGYNATECAIHLNRYLMARQYVAQKRVLDIACGEGYGSKLLKDWGAASVVGVDVSPEALKVANELFSGDGITFLNHTAEELPFEANSFDVVVSFETIEHLSHPEKFLAEISRVIKFNGTVLVSCPNDDYYDKNEEAFSNPYHKRRYNWFEFKELTEQYLGNGEAWFFGFALKGFSTLPLEATREPENDALPKQMTDLLNYSEPSTAALLQAERYLNHWNACYYVGVWGTGTDKSYNGETFFPAEFLSPADDPAKEELAHWKKSYLQEKLDTEKQFAALNRKYENSSAELRQEKQSLVKELETSTALLERQKQIYAAEMEQQRQEHSTELELREQAFAKGMEDWSAKLETQKRRIAELEKALTQKEAQLHAGYIERERTSNLLRVAETEKACLWGRINNFEETIRQKDEAISWCNNEIRKRDEQLWEKNRLLNSKAMKLVFCFWRLRDRILGRK